MEKSRINLRISFVIIAFLMCLRGTVPDVLAQDYCETVVARLAQGDGPGQYIYCDGGGFNLEPRCVEIDPNNGSFYVPEADKQGRLRVHIFSKEGKFVKMLLPDDKANSAVYSAAVGYEGDFYLCYFWKDNPDGVMIVGHFDKDGKLLNYFGEDGIVSFEEMDRARQAYRNDEGVLYARKYIRNGPEKILVSKDNVLSFVIYRKGRAEIYRKFDAVDGKLLWKRAEGARVPEDVALWEKTRSELVEKINRARKNKLGEEYVRQLNIDCLGFSKSAFGPDGHLYYLDIKYKEKKAEIIKVVVSD